MPGMGKQVHAVERHSRSFLGLPVPKMLAFFSDCTTLLTGSVTVLGNNMSLGLAAIDSV